MPGDVVPVSPMVGVATAADEGSVEEDVAILRGGASHATSTSATSSSHIGGIVGRYDSARLSVSRQRFRRASQEMNSMGETPETRLAIQRMKELSAGEKTLMAANVVLAAIPYAGGPLALP